MCNRPVPVGRYQDGPHEMIGRLHDIVACMHRLSAYSSVFQIMVRVRDHRLSMHISNRLHWVLSALRTALPEFRALHLCHSIRKVAGKALYPLTDMLRQASATHRSPRRAFLVAQVR